MFATFDLVASIYNGPLVVAVAGIVLGDLV